MPERSGMLCIQRPVHRAPKGFRSLPHPQRHTAAPGDFVGGGLRSWLAVRCTRTATPPSCGCSALYRGPRLKRGVPRSGLCSEEWESPRSGVQYASGTGSERAKVASVAERNPPRALGPSAAGSLSRKSPYWGAP
jgi:hypothetical protein